MRGIASISNQYAFLVGVTRAQKSRHSFEIEVSLVPKYSLIPALPNDHCGQIFFQSVEHRELPRQTSGLGPRPKVPIGVLNELIVHVPSQSIDHGSVDSRATRLPVRAGQNSLWVEPNRQQGDAEPEYEVFNKASSLIEFYFMILSLTLNFPW